MDLLFTRKQKRILLAAHRGVSGGNILQNTIGAYETALACGADMIETDALRSTDGKFFCFHSGQERGLFRTDKDIRKMSSEEILGLKFFNSMQEQVGEKVNLLDDVLEHFKGKCFINVDRSWFYWDEIIKLIKRHDMYDQILLKSPAEKDLLSALEQSGGKIMYMPILRKAELYDFVGQYKLSTVVVETNYSEESDYIASDEFIERVHKDGRLVWANALTLDDTTRLAAGHDDNTSILVNRDVGWGWLINKGYDIVQTDWPMLVKNYIENK